MKLFLIFLSFFALFFFQAFAEKPSDDLGRIRLLRESALNAKDIPLAIKFTRQLGEILKDPRQKLENSIFLISLLVDSEKNTEAFAEISEIEKSFTPQITSDLSIKTKIEYYKGILDFRSGDYKTAEMKLKSLIEPHSLTDTAFNCRIIFAICAVFAAENDWSSAARYAKKMELEGTGTEWAEAGKTLNLAFLLITGNAKFPDFTAPDDGARILLSDIVLIFAHGKTDEAINLYKKISKEELVKNPGAFYGLFALGTASLKKNNHDAALLFFSDASKTAAESSAGKKIFVILAEINEAKGDIPNALNLYEYFLSVSDPNISETEKVRLQYAACLKKNNNNDKAFEEYKRVMNSSADVDLKLRAAEEAFSLCLEIKNFVAAEDISKFTAGLKIPNADGLAFLQMAEISFAQKKWPQAASLFLDAASKISDAKYKDTAFLGAVKSYYSAGDYDMTIAVFKKNENLFLQGESLQECLFIEALAIEKLGKRDDANSLLISFLEKYPNSHFAPAIIFEIAKIFFEKNDYKEAGERFASLFSKYPDNNLAPRAVYCKIYSDFLSGREQDAENNVMFIAEKYPKSEYSAMALMWLADKKKESGKDNDAENIYAKISREYAEYKKFAAEAVCKTAQIAERKGDPQKAAALLDELSEKFPDEPAASEAYFLRGNMLCNAGNYEKAIPFFMKAAMKRPNSILEANAFIRLGDAYFSISQNDSATLLKAAEYYKKASDSDNASLDILEESLFKLGKCEEKLGDTGAALARYKELIYNYEADWKRGLKRDKLWLAKTGTSAIKLYLGKGTRDGILQSEKIYSNLEKMEVETISQMRQDIDAAKEKIQKEGVQ